MDCSRRAATPQDVTVAGPWAPPPTRAGLQPAPHTPANHSHTTDCKKLGSPHAPPPRPRPAFLLAPPPATALSAWTHTSPSQCHQATNTKTQPKAEGSSPTTERVRHTSAAHQRQIQQTRGRATSDAIRSQPSPPLTARASKPARPPALHRNDAAGRTRRHPSGQPQSPKHRAMRSTAVPSSAARWTCVGGVRQPLGNSPPPPSSPQPHAHAVQMKQVPIGGDATRAPNLLGTGQQLPALWRHKTAGDATLGTTRRRHGPLSQSWAAAGEGGGGGWGRGGGERDARVQRSGERETPAYRSPPLPQPLFFGCDTGHTQRRTSGGHHTPSSARGERTDTGAGKPVGNSEVRGGFRERKQRKGKKRKEKCRQVTLG